MNTLDNIIENLKIDDNIDAVFMTGSNHNSEAKAYSDIDLVVILKENKIRTFFQQNPDSEF